MKLRIVYVLVLILQLVACGQTQTNTVANPQLELTATPKLVATTTEAFATPHPAADSEGCPNTLPGFPNASKISEEVVSNWERIASYEFTGHPNEVYDYYDQMLLPVGWSAYSRKSHNPEMVSDAAYVYHFRSTVLLLQINNMKQQKRDVNQYTVRLAFGRFYADGLDKYCSHLYP